MGTFLGQALKSRQGDQEWLDFFALISSAFAHREETTPVPRFSTLSPEATYSAIADAEARLDALNMMRGLSIAANAIYKTAGPGKGWFYHLIILNSLERNVKITPYDRDSFSQALHDYAHAEADAARGEKIEPVLVSAGPLDNLRRAYPNFFLDINDFVKIVTEIVAQVRK